MIELIYGRKGSGKTKKILESANKTVASTKGNIVFIDDNNRYMYDLSRDIRFVAASDYGIKSYEELIIFICGGIAMNYGIEAVYIDGLLKITNTSLDNLEDFFTRLETLSEDNGFKAVLTISADLEEFPEYLKKFI